MRPSFRLRLMSLVAVLGLLLSACGGASAPASPTAATGGTTTEPTAATGGTTTEPTADAGGTDAEPTADAGGTDSGDTGTGGDTAMGLPAECTNVELQYWNPFTGPDGPFMGQLVDEFNAANPNIQAVMTTQSEYYTQLSTAAASNTLPDVAIVHADQVATQAFRNVIAPMDDVVEQLGIEGSDFPEAVWNAGEVAGQRYAIPLDIHPMTMFYNADLLGGAGLDEAPMSGDDFAQAAETLTADGNYGFMVTTGFPIQQIFQQLLHQFGGTEFNEDGTEATWNSEAGVQALQWLKDAQANYSESNLEVDAELNAFKGGNVGMIWNGIWQTTNVTGEGVEFEGRATSVPQIGDQPAVWAGSHQLAIPVSANPDECKRAAAGIFIKYLMENSVTWAQAGQIPASNTVRESDEFMSLEPQASIAPSVENAIFPPSVPGITDAFAPLNEAVSAVMAGEATDLQAALDDAAERANQILADNRTNYGDAPSQP